MKRYLVIDIDSCALSTISPHEHCLAPGILAFAKRIQFDGFYICTHRCYGTVPAILTKSAEYYRSFKKDPKQILTSQVKLNFEKVTQLPCIRVSTPDDVNGPRDVHEQCGSGFTHLLKLAEENQGEVKEFKQDPVTEYDPDSKNVQLTQIALHAKAKHPNEKIHLAFVDDQVKICQNAMKIRKDKSWPEQVRLHIFAYNANDPGMSVTQIELLLNPMYIDSRSYQIFHGKRRGAQDSPKPPESDNVCVIL